MDASEIRSDQARLKVRSYRRLWRGLGMFVVGLIILAALVLTLVRGLAHYSDQLREPVTDWVEAQLGFSVSVGAIDFTLAGYRPQLVIDEITIAEQIQAERLSLSLSIRKSLRQWRLVAQTVTLDGLSLPLTRQPDGPWVVDADLGLSEQTGPGPALADLYHQISRLGHLSLREAELIFRFREYESRIGMNAAAYLAPTTWSASGEIDFPGLAAQPLAFTSTGQFHPAMDARFYLDAEQMDLAFLQQQINRFGDQILLDMLGGCPAGRDPEHCKEGLPLVDRGQYSGRLWFEWQRGAFRQLTLDAAVSDLAVRRRGLIAPQDRHARLGDIETQLKWQRTADGWRLDTQDLTITDARGRSVPTEQVAVQERDQALHFAIDHADLGHLAVWLATAPLPEAFLALLDGNLPRGVAENVALTFSDGQIKQGYLQLVGFGNTTGDYLSPVISHAYEPRGGLDLTLYRQPGGWLVDVDQRDLLLAVPGMFRTPLTIEQLSGRLYWLDAGEPHLYSPDLVVETPDLAMHGGFIFRPVQDDQPAFLNIDSRFAVYQLNQAPDYLPRNLIDSDTLGWLDTYLAHGQASGTVHDGHFVFHGAPAQAPFLDGGGYLSVLFGFDDLTLPYQPNWPPLEQASGNIAFVNQQFHAGISQGKIGELPLAGARVSLFDLSKPVLSIALRQTAPLADVLATVTQMPLVDPEHLSAYRASGEGRFGLDISLDFYQADRLEITGFYDLNGNALRIHDSQIALTELQGRLRFNRDLLFAEGVTGQFFERPISVDLHTNQDQRGVVFSRLTADGYFDDRLWDELGLSAQWRDFAARQVQGHAPFSLDLHIPHAIEPISAQINSDLRGLTINAPAPLDKAADVPWPLQIKMAFDQGTVHQVSGQVQPDVAVSPWFFRIKDLDDFAEQGQFSLTDQPVGDRERPHKISVNLAMGSVDVTQWLDWVSLLPAGEGKTDVPTLLAVLELDQLSMGGYQAAPGTVRIDYQDNWQISFDGDDLVGNINTAGGRQIDQLDLDFQRLVFHPEPSTLDKKAADVTDDSQPATWPLDQLPSLNLQIAHAAIGDMQLGQIIASGGLDTDAAGQLIYRLSPLDIITPTARAEGALRIVPDGDSDQQTELLFSGSAHSLEQLLNHYSPPSPIEGGRLDLLHLSLTWPGVPTDLRLSELTGGLRLDARDGRIIEIDPGAGRLVGLLSLGALTNRLRLDFRDITEKGLRFDRLVGEAHLANGVLTLDQLQMVNPSVALIMHGTTGLEDEWLDLTAEVYADTGMLLPLIGTVAGGPLVGGAVLMLQETFRSLAKQRHPQLIYHITGSIDEPEINRVSRND